ncbi:MAG: VWA domain-containing protein [Planctomycetes bacterium]|nr:VWA domain-containing protein [Planctomycetota bacterium]
MPASAPAVNQSEIWKLVAQLDDDDPEVRFKAARRFMELGKAALPVFEAIIKNKKPEPVPNTDDEDEAFFAAAARSTTQPKTNLEEIKKLVAKLGNNDIKVREEATESLKKIGRSAVPTLESVVGNEDSDPEIAERAKAIIEHITNQYGGRAYCVVYVVDCSGSMIYTFDRIRKELLISLGQLKEEQDFHLIYFTKGTPIENPPKQLIVANRQNKVMSAEFLKNLVPEGMTDPVPAMERAFEVLKDVKNKGKLIYFLTDGQFPESKAALAKLLAERNPSETDRAMICVFQYGEDKHNTSGFLKKLAEKNKGRYKYVNTEEE